MPALRKNRGNGSIGNCIYRQFLSCKYILRKGADYERISQNIKDKRRLLQLPCYGGGLEKQRYIQCAIVSVAEEKKAVTVYYCDEAAPGMAFAAGGISGTVTVVTHTQTDDAAAAGETGNDRTVLTLSKGIAADNTAIGLEKAAAVAGMTADDITALKGVLKQYE